MSEDVKTYKVLKIWYTDARDKDQALRNIKHKEPSFTSANPNFRHDTRRG